MVPILACVDLILVCDWCAGSSVLEAGRVRALACELAGEV